MLPSTPTPNYPSAEIRLLSEQLADAQARKQRLQKSGADTSEILREILGLKRQIREGGQLRAGDYLGDGQYLLLDKVGSGGFGSVWRAQDGESNETVAIKVLHANLAGDPERLARFVRGARIMKELGHEAVTRVLKEHEEDGGWHYAVMEFLPGGDFRRAVLERRIGWDQAVLLMLGVCDAMALAHSRGIVHRDIKPANILLGASGELKLTDFDLVSAPDTTGGTRTGAMGTFVYTDPACADHPMDADPRADVYSLGMTILFGVLGIDLPAAVHGRAYDLIRVLPLTFPIREVLQRATDVNDREARFANAGALRDALREATECDRLTQFSRLIAARFRRAFEGLLGLALAVPLLTITFFVPTMGPLLFALEVLQVQVGAWEALILVLIGMSIGAYATVRLMRWVRRRNSSLARLLSR